MLKQYDDKIVQYLETRSTSQLTRWIEKNKTPWTQPYNNDVSYYIFQEKHPALFFFRYEADALKYNETYQNLAKEHKQELVFTHADLSWPKYRKIGEFFGVSRYQMPTFMIIDHKGGEINKYFYSKDVKESDAEDFILKWKNGEIKPYIKSEPILEQPTEELVKTIVAQNFEEVVLKSDKDLLVLFYAPFSANCKNLLYFLPWIAQISSKPNRF
ncbi:unnamed protein product [Blepharisma stoltei]|uniref:Thioredoxin domain-containing protein n=1 Tax=Blepharisma stoltei TaxID=1481888 RepID=A0AAU9IJL0_9CILI|nr:unnamed protein product [Blepharisma stoltei]